MSRPSAKPVSGAASGDFAPSDTLSQRSAAPNDALAREVLRFVLRLGVSYALLLALWWPLAGPYRRAVVAGGNLGFAASGPARAVAFHEFSNWSESGPKVEADIVVLVHRPEWVDDQGRRQHVMAKAIATFSQPFSATAFLLALFGATRISWTARLARGGAALAALHLFMLGCVAADVVCAFAENGAPLPMPRWCFDAISIMHARMTDWPAGVLIVPLLLWLAACWPRRRAMPALAR